MHLTRISVLLLVLNAAVVTPAQKPLRVLPEPSDRPLPAAGIRFVDAAKGNDAGDGSQSTPWRTINHSLTQIGAGETLALRGGSYFENVYCAAAGTKDEPITIRAYPGERAIIDGGLREFQDDPSACWEPLENGEYRSTKNYRNTRDVLGSFAKSNIGLQTYWKREDLVAENELWIQDKDTGAMAPVYCGPGLWYDKASGRIHCRLAHTSLSIDAVPDYAGETDPRKVPLAIVPFASVPLEIDQAMHVRFQDLVIRGGGHDTVELNFGIDLTFDNCTIFCGTYGVRARSTGPLRMTRCGVHGGIPPWAFRDENSLHTNSSHHYDPFIPELDHQRRNIARLNTHALVVTEGSYEFEVFFFPRNHDWEIDHCDFTSAHDGVYLSGRSIRFHHNHVTNIQDDAIYLSSPSQYTTDNIHIYQNHITQALMAFGCHSRGGPTGNIYIYRNIADLRRGVNAKRPRPDLPGGSITNYHIFLVHGRKLRGIESMFFYQNTFISPAAPDAFAHRLLTATHADTKRRAFNNICIYKNRYPWLRAYPGVDNDVQSDGNLHWCADPAIDLPDGFLEKVRTSKFSDANKERYPAGWAGQSMVANPQFQSFELNPEASNDYRLKEGSPARGTGVVLPGEWEDPLRPGDETKPDLGALPFGSRPFEAGRP